MGHGFLPYLIAEFERKLREEMKRRRGVKCRRCRHILEVFDRGKNVERRGRVAKKHLGGENEGISAKSVL